MAPARRTIRRENLLLVASWNVLSLSEDHRLSYLLDELSRLRVDTVGLLEARKSGSGKTNQ